MSQNSYKFYVGMDVAKYKLDVISTFSPTIITLANSKDVIKAILKQLPNKRSNLVVMDALVAFPLNYCITWASFIKLLERRMR